MRDHLRAARWDFWVPLVLSILFVIATVMTTINPQWIETLFEASPDEGSGESEWWITAIVGALALASIAVTRWRWKAIRVG
jgi:hypothetical protein